MATLTAYVLSKTRWGWRVAAEGGGYVVMVKGQRVSHVLHLLLGVLTCSAWWFLVWLPLVLFGGEQRITVGVDAGGRAGVVRTASDYLKYGLAAFLVIAWVIGVSNAAGTRTAPGNSIPVASSTTTASSPQNTPPTVQKKSGQKRSSEAQLRANKLTWDQLSEKTYQDMTQEERRRFDQLQGQRDAAAMKAAIEEEKRNGQ
jgi:hypothetical protein